MPIGNETPAKCSSCGGDYYHYAGCGIGEHGELIAHQSYHPTDLLSFEQVVAWFDVAPRTVERMNLSWSRPTRKKLRRILFRDLLAHVERRKE